MFQAVLWLVSLTSIVFFIHAILKGRPIDFFASCVWSLMMVIPFLISEPTFIASAASVQRLALLVSSLAVFSGDWLSIQLKKKFHKVSPGKDYRPLDYKLECLIFIITIGLWSYHLYLMPEIPLVAKYFSAMNTEAQSVVSRENAAKMLPISRIFQYAFHSSLLVLCPILLASLALRKKWKLAFIYLLISLLYSRAALAKGPIYILVASLTLLAFTLNFHRINRMIFKRTVLTGVAACLFFIVFIRIHPMSPFNVKISTTSQLATLHKFKETDDLSVTYADYSRLSSFEPEYAQLSALERNVFFTFYRVLLIPVEVAHRWYSYYPKHTDFLGFSGLTPTSRSDPHFEHPAQVIGSWAFRQRFPTLYTSTNHSYASFDADAHARWGMLGVVIVSVVVFLMLGVAAYCSDHSIMSQTVYTVYIVVLGVTLPMASLQAILVAQGIGTLLCVMILMKVNRIFLSTVIARRSS